MCSRKGWTVTRKVYECSKGACYLFTDIIIYKLKTKMIYLIVTTDRPFCYVIFKLLNVRLLLSMRCGGYQIICVKCW